MEAPRLPRSVRALNTVGRAAARLGIRPGRLDVESLLAEASKRTELPDSGDEAFRTALGRLVSSLENEGRLSALGRFIVRDELVNYLERCLGVCDWHARHPEIGAATVEQPIFIVGQGRTGTTILHELLALDPANRVPLTWEVDHPSPPPERATCGTDPRIELTQRDIERSESLIPDFKRMHRMGAQLPQECVRITAMECRSMIFAATWRVPGYVRWLLDEADMGPAYAGHRRMLQLLQWRCPAERWVVKSPGHLWHLDAMLEEYPDARLVQTHRDPLRVLSSLTSLEVVLRTMVSDDVDVTDVAREWSNWLCTAWNRSVAFRESRALPPSRIVDLQFRSHQGHHGCGGEIQGRAIGCGVAVVQHAHEAIAFPEEDPAGSWYRALAGAIAVRHQPPSVERQPRVRWPADAREGSERDRLSSRGFLRGEECWPGLPSAEEPEGFVRKSGLANRDGEDYAAATERRSRPVDTGSTEERDNASSRRLVAFIGDPLDTVARPREALDDDSGFNDRSVLAGGGTGKGRARQREGHECGQDAVGDQAPHSIPGLLRGDYRSERGPASL